MRLLKVYSEEKEKLELLVAAIAPAVEALSQLITDQTLNAAAGETALITLHNLVSALHTRSGLYARDRCAGARNASEFVLTTRDDRDVGMQATAATIFVSLLQQEHQAAQTAAAPAAAPVDPARSVLAPKCAAALARGLESILQGPSESKSAPAARDVVRAMAWLFGEYRAGELRAEGALKLLARTVELMSEDEVYTPAIEAIRNLLDQQDHSAIAFLADAAEVGRLRTRISALLDLHKARVVDLSLSARCCSNHVIQRLDLAQPELLLGGKHIAASERKHIMISHAPAEREQAAEVAVALEKRELLVWRYEVGTEWCGKMGARYDRHKILEAVDRSFCLLCLVSREYVESKDCQWEVGVRLRTPTTPPTSRPSSGVAADPSILPPIPPVAHACLAGWLCIERVCARRRPPCRHLAFPSPLLVLHADSELGRMERAGVGRHGGREDADRVVRVISPTQA